MGFVEAFFLKPKGEKKMDKELQGKNWDSGGGAGGTGMGLPKHDNPYLQTDEDKELFSAFLICPYCGDVVKVPIKACWTAPQVHPHFFKGINTSGRIDFKRVEVPAIQLTEEAKAMLIQPQGGIEVA